MLVRGLCGCRMLCGRGGGIRRGRGRGLVRERVPVCGWHLVVCGEQPTGGNDNGCTFVDVGLLCVELLRCFFVRVGLDAESFLDGEDFE